MNRPPVTQFEGRVPLVLTALIGSFALGGCSEDDGGSDPADAALVLARLLPGGFDPSTEAIERGHALAVTDIDLGGGVHGFPLEFDTRSTARNPDIAAQMTEDLIDEGHELIVGAVEELVHQRVAEVANADGAVVISGASDSAGLGGLAGTARRFRTAPSQAGLAHTLAESAFTDGRQEIAVLASLDLDDVGFADAFAASYLAQACAPTPCRLQRVDLPAANAAAAFDPAAALAAVWTPTTDALLIALDFERATAVIEASQSANFSGHYLLGPTASPPMIAPPSLAEVADRLRWADFLAPSGPSRDEVHTAHLATFGPGTLAREGYASYDAVFVLALAIQAAQSRHASDVAAALTNVANPPGAPIYAGEFDRAITLLANGDDIDYVGASGPIDFDAHGDVDAPRAIHRYVDGVIAADLPAG